VHVRRALAVVHGTWTVAFPAMILSGTPASAWSRTWARVSFRAEAGPSWVSATRSIRISVVPVTTARMASGPSRVYRRIPREG
jgi:hypothetical protein